MKHVQNHTTVTEPAAAAATRAEDTRAAWDRVAPGYSKFNTPAHLPTAEEGLKRAGIRAGTRFLDVAAGGGALSVPAARRGAEATAIDISPKMIEQLQARARAEGIRVETHVMDGHSLSFEDGSFDVAGSQFGVMLFPDMPRALREMVRVVRPGGRVLIHAFGDPQKIEFISFLVGAIQSVRPNFEGMPKNPPPLEFQLAAPQKLRQELTRAGLEEVTVETIDEVMEFRSGTDLWNWLIWSNPIVERILGEMLQLTDSEREAVRTALERMVRDRAGGGSTAKLTSPVNIGIGRKPAA